MTRAGLDIAGCEFNPRDGTFKVIAGKPVDASDIDIDDTTSPDRSGTEMAEIKLNYVNSYRDPRNNKWRHQFRRKGCRKIMLRGRPGCAEFMAHYAELLAQSENAAAHIGASRIQAGHHRRGDRQVSASTRSSPRDWRRRRRPRGVRSSTTFASAGRRAVSRYGENRIGTIHRKNITDVLAGKPPTSQKGWLKTLRHF